VEVFGNQLPNYSAILIFRRTHSYTACTPPLPGDTPWDVYIYATGDPNRTWYDSTFNPINPTNVTIGPGDGGFIAPAESCSVMFTDTPHVPVLPVNLPCQCWKQLSRQTNGPGTFENVTGLTPEPCDRVAKWDISTQTYSCFTY
jgi:hypothetical protein